MQHLQMAMAAAERIFGIIDTKPFIRRKTIKILGEKQYRLQYKIFQCYKFSYVQKKNLQNINLEINNRVKK